MMHPNTSESRVMNVMRLTRLGGPDAFEAATVAVPVPGPQEFLVRVGACGVCGHDALARGGSLSAEVGDILGHEIAGTVESVGSTELAGWLGKRVALVQRRPCGECTDCLAGNTSHCRLGPGFYGDEIPGGYAEYVLAGPLNAVEVPDSIDDATAAILACGVGTSFHALQLAEVTERDVIVITGAGGGVGLHAVQLANHFNVVVIATTSSPNKVKSIRDAGASVVLINPSIKDLRSAAALHNRPRGADAVLEITGAPQFETSLRALGPRGRLVLIGNVSPAKLQLDPGLTILKELQIRGSAHATRSDLVEVVALVSAGKIRPVISQKFSLGDVAQAHAVMDARNQRGRLVVIP
jgi:acryloyl-coenzyme A reductase